ncbi:hypothetical protein MRB53_022648 [Persea americana]|uniref:Uncharacterized protein n=1 Tax=Persea americana TaxID=3435 RepID=A0ACC2L7B5_PERAE|nr:hypothetical protein MRB53_022648 [Persea americana]
MNLLALFKHREMGTVFYDKRVSVGIRGDAGAEHSTKEMEGGLWKWAGSGASDDGVPGEGVWVGNLVEHLVGVVEVAVGRCSAELEDLGGCKVVLEEVVSGHLGVDLE